MLTSAAGWIADALDATFAVFAGLVAGLQLGPFMSPAAVGGSSRRGGSGADGGAVRDPLVDRVAETIRSNSLLLFGGLRLTRTAILRELRCRLSAVADRDYEFFPVYVDLHGTPQRRFFPTLARAVFDELSEALGHAVPVAAAERDQYGYRALVANLREVVARLAEKTGKRVKLVLLLDGVDQLNGYDPHVNQKLRSLFMKSFAEHLVAVVSGVGIRRAWEREGSPWYNFFEEIEVRSAEGAGRGRR